MISISAHEQAAFETALQEFSGLTNEQAYVHIFSQRMMKPIPKKMGEYFGCDQRLDMQPSLQELITKVPLKGQVFDVGAGAGDVVDFALKNIAKGTVINLEEPNSVLLKEYLKKLKNHQLTPGIIYEGPLQDYYQGKRQGIIPQQAQNLILAIHMIYHLTDFTQPQINPQKDLIDAISFLYSLLAPGSSIFIVYADLLDRTEGEAVCGIAEKYFRHYYPEAPFANNLIAIYQARNQLLGSQGDSMISLLSQQHPDTQPTLHSERHITHFFGKSIADIAVLGLATELCPSDRNKFDIHKLQFCLDYVKHNADRIGLHLEEGNIPQKGLWRANEPQVLVTITKNHT